MADIIDSLLAQGSKYSFIQAYRLLSRFLYHGREPDEARILREICVRPDLSLSFPGRDIVSVSEAEGGTKKFTLTTTFLGLYGASSPLPTFYTEDLMVEASEDSTITRDFLDILNGPLYRHFFACWTKYRLFYQLLEKAESDTMERLYCLSGLGSEKIRNHFADPYGLLRYLGLTTQIQRPAESLRIMLSDALDEPDLSIEQFVSKRIAIPEDQRMVLGAQAGTLGEDTCLGMEVEDCTGQFRVHTGLLVADSFHRWLPDQPQFKRLGELISFYVDQPVSWDVDVRIEPQQITPCCLGQPEWSQLGWNTWLASDVPPRENTVRFVWPSRDNMQGKQCCTTLVPGKHTEEGGIPC